TITLGLLLSLSVALNIIQARSQMKAYDISYGDLAKSQTLNNRILSLLESGEIEMAKIALERKIGMNEKILSICMSENCSSRAREILSANPSQ
ncbi:hypothetical protein, partial [Microbulbifer sp. JSM ZJ756]